ncbi:MAG: putative Heterogeneous nuclear ribonucleoprotein L, partial [Streblomastix strix]
KAVLLHDHAFFLNFSQSQYIHKEVPFKKTNCIHHGERILLMTIHNPIHPITVQVIQAVFRGYKLQKAVIFHTNGVQCLSEFESPEDARSAREALDGREIYAGCCLMKIEYSSMRRPLSVRRNTEFAIDLTGIFEL